MRQLRIWFPWRAVRGISHDFYVELYTFLQKARLMSGGHQTEPPAIVLTYASVVSKETVHIAFTITTLNNLQVRASDVQNAYLTAPCAEKSLEY